MTTQFVSLGQLARRPAATPFEQCDLCAAPVGADHRHVLDSASGQVLCACQACAILLTGAEAGAGRRRLIPTRRVALSGELLTDARWSSLHVPVGMAFFVRSTEGDGARAYFPSPAGPTEAYLEDGAWQAIAAQESLLATMEPGVEALLVNRLDDRRDCYLAPIDTCYRLVGLVRAYWHGFSGGSRLWDEIDRFFEELRETAHAQH